jgi:hypothetical protein
MWKFDVPSLYRTPASMIGRFATPQSAPPLSPWPRCFIDVFYDNLYSIDNNMASRAQMWRTPHEISGETEGMSSRVKSGHGGPRSSSSRRAVEG